MSEFRFIWLLSWSLPCYLSQVLCSGSLLVTKYHCDLFSLFFLAIMHRAIGFLFTFRLYKKVNDENGAYLAHFTNQQIISILKQSIVFAMIIGMITTALVSLP